MTLIIQDMAMLDARLGDDYKSRRVADTSRVYASVLARYGYTEEDYLASQKKYINDAGRYVKMVKKAVLNLEARKRELEAVKRAQDAIHLKEDALKLFAPNRIYLMDSLNLEDTVLFDFDFQEGLDICFRGPEMIVWADTVTVNTVEDAEIR